MEKNVDIVKFMGGKLIYTTTEEMPHGSKFDVNVECWDLPYSIPLNDISLAKIGIFKYHRSWDWLIPVVEKIEKDFNFPIIRNCGFPIEIIPVYQEVVNFIEKQQNEL